MRKIGLSALALILSLAAPATAQPSAGPAPEPILKPGDLVRLVVWQKPEMSGDLEVLSDSTLSHPLFREVKVAGVALRIAEDRVQQLLTRYDEVPRFVMLPLLRVVVGGEVRTPNVHSFPPHVTVAQAIAISGGPTERGRLDRVVLIREGYEETLDLTRPDSRPSQLLIRSGDQILVARRMAFVRDYLGPLASVTSAVVTILNFVLR